MKLWEMVGKKVKLTLNNGKKVVGTIEDWTDPGTSISEEQEITINFHIYAESDYKDIEIIKE